MGEELATHRDAVVVRGEDLGETLVRHIGRGGERRRQVCDPDPAERAVLPGHLDPGLDHLGERGLDPPPAATGLNDDISPLAHISSTMDGGNGAQPLGLTGLRHHQIAHAAGQPERPGRGLHSRRLSHFRVVSDLLARQLNFSEQFRKKTV